MRAGSWRRLEARQVGRFDEERTRCRCVAIELQTFNLPAEERPIAGVQDRSRRQLVGRQKVAKHPLARRVELRDGPYEESRSELIGVAKIQDVHAVYVGVGRTILERYETV